MTRNAKVCEKVRAYELGKGSRKEKELITQGRIRRIGNQYQIFNINGVHCQIGYMGDYFVVHSNGAIDLVGHLYFLSNYEHLGRNIYEKR